MRTTIDRSGVRAMVCLLTAALFACAEATAETGCEPEWAPMFGTEPGLNNPVFALTEFDEGSGPTLYVGGTFTSAGGAAAHSIARWDGSAWTSVGSGIDSGGDLSGVFALGVFDDGSGGGPALYAGGGFTFAGGVAAHNIARWDGKAWTPVGTGMNGSVSALTVFDDGSGSGPALYAGGNFTTTGDVAANYIARWDGKAWTPVGTGMNGSVSALTVFDDGSGGGPALYAGGNFTTAGDIAANRIARWDGSAWTALGSGMNNSVYALTVFDDGSGGGPALYAGGDFTTAGGVTVNRVARWNGVAWSALGSGTVGMSGHVNDLAVFDDGSGAGAALYAAGSFFQVGGVFAYHIARWDGSAWTALGSGVNHQVNALAVFDEGAGAGSALYAGGLFQSAGDVTARRMARWDGAVWTSMGEESGLNDPVWALTVFDDGAGPTLYAGGQFVLAEGVAVNGIARREGNAWAPLGSGTNGVVYALAVFDDGAGAALYAGGTFTLAGDVTVNRIARWDGSTWTALGSGMNHPVTALAVFDDGAGGGPALYAGGGFSIAGGRIVNRVAKWDGVAWTPLGSGMNSGVGALAVFDNGSGTGPALYAGGTFTQAGGLPAHGIARWDGSEWAALGSGLNGGSSFPRFASALTVFDDGSGGGPALYAGGNFLTAGGRIVNHIAKWDGIAWSPLGSGMNARVSSLAVFDEGSGAGPALYAGGLFTQAGGVAVEYIARWDGTAWTSLGTGMSDGTLSPAVFALAPFDEGFGAERVLYVGGSFTASPAGDSYLAAWRSCPADIEILGDLNADGVVDGADLGLLLGAWGMCGNPRNCAADLNADGVVDQGDLGILLRAWS